MPSKKRNGAQFKKIIIWLIVITLLVLMFISFSTPQHLTEIVVYP